jgi:hypothetical protein
MKRIAHALLVLSLATLVAPVANACSCVRSTLDERFDQREIVFLAYIRDVSDLAALNARLSDEDDIEPGVNYGLRLKFEVIETFKGDPSLVPALFTNYGGGDCGAPAMPGSVLLVGTGTDGHVSICGLAMKLAFRSCKDVHFLERLRQRGRDGITPIGFVEREPDQFDDYFMGLVNLGRKPWDIRLEECPIITP